MTRLCLEGAVALPQEAVGVEWMSKDSRKETAYTKNRLCPAWSLSGRRAVLIVLEGLESGIVAIRRSWP